MSATIRIFENEDDLAVHAADFIIRTLSEAVAARGRAMLALTGGTTPRKLYELLSQPGMRHRINWARTFVFLTDERFVSMDDEANNFAMARRLLLDPVSAPPENLFPVPTQLASAADAADAYAASMNTAFSPHEAGEPPQFDLILLGLGADGHVGALFPGATSLSVKDRLVVGCPPGTMRPKVDRITMTFPVLNAARVVLFLVSGAGKASVLRDVLEGGCSREECPAVAVAPDGGELYWFVDQAAATRLSQQGK